MGPEQGVVNGRSWLAQLASLEGWRRIARAFFMEWRMVYEELLVGLTIAGFISVLVPRGFWVLVFVAGGDAPSLTPGARDPATRHQPASGRLAGAGRSIVVMAPR